MSDKATLVRPDTRGLLRKLEPRPAGLNAVPDTRQAIKPEWAFGNPFAVVIDGRWYRHCTAAEQIKALRGTESGRPFTAEQCRQVLDLPDVQKSVRTAADARLRKLEKAQAKG